MRRLFFKLLYDHMKRDKRIFALTGDLGYIGFDRIRDDFPDRFLNTGAAEQAMIGIACGLAMSGKIPVVYSITPFLLYRPFETIRNYIDHEKLNVKLIGSGRDSDYEHDGFSHYAGDDRKIMKNFKHIQSCWPEYKEDLPDILSMILSRNRPYYLNLKR